MALGTGVAAVSIFIHRIILQTQFMVNDDSAMMLASTGSLWGRSSPDLVFINPVIGGAITLLERAIPGVPWYLVMLDLAMFVIVASVVAMWRNQRSNDSKVEWVLFVMFVASIQAWIWINVSFTVNAILLAGVGAMLMGHRADERGRQALLRSLLGGVMIGTAVWLRWAGAIGALLLIVPYLVMNLGSRLRWRVLLPGIAVAAMLVGAGAGTTWYRYHDKASWQDYFEYNSVRTQVHDTARRFHMEDEVVLSSTGWSDTDAHLFASWYFPDRDVFSIESVQAAVDSSSGNTAFNDAVSKAWRRDFKHMVVAAAAAIVVTALLLSRGRNRIALVGLTGWMIAVSLALATTRKLPMRVAIAFVFLVAAAALIQDRPTVAIRKSVLRAALTLTVVFGLLTTLDLIGGQSLIKRHHREFEAIAEGMSQATSADDLVVSWAGAYRGSWVDPRSPGDSIPVDLLPLGWRTFTPPWLALAASHGASDVTSAIATDPSVLLAVDRRATPDDKSFEHFVAEHLGIDGRMRPVALVGENAEVELNDIGVQVHLDEARNQIVENGFDGSEIRRSLREATGSGWVMSRLRWPQDIIGWVDTQATESVVDPSEWDFYQPRKVLPPRMSGSGDVWAVVLYDGRVSDLELAVADPDVPGRWWFNARVRGGEPGLWSVYLLDGDSAYPIEEIANLGGSRNSGSRRLYVR